MFRGQIRRKTKKKLEKKHNLPACGLLSLNVFVLFAVLLYIMLKMLNNALLYIRYLNYVCNQSFSSAKLMLMSNMCAMRFATSINILNMNFFECNENLPKSFSKQKSGCKVIHHFTLLPGFRCKCECVCGVVYICKSQKLN